MAEFSIIIPVFNCAVFLPGCINSVLSQTIADFELLLIDDGSTDGSSSICDRFALEDPRVRVFHKSNGGVASARNVGLDNAGGNYFLFVDGDDTIEPELLECILPLFDEHESKMAVFGMAFDYYNESGELEKTDVLSVGHKGEVSVGDLRRDYSGYYLDNALSSACNKVFSADLIRKHGFRFSENMTLYEDLEFVLQYLAVCERIMFSDRVLYRYRHFSEAPHLNQSLRDMSRLKDNLDQLIITVLALDSPEAAQQTADLCAQLFDEHLITARYSRSKLSQAAEQIRNCSALTALYQAGFEPAEASSPSWQLISGGQITELYRSLQKRRRIRRIKRIVKPLLKRIGLYH